MRKDNGGTGEGGGKEGTYRLVSREQKFARKWKRWGRLRLGQRKGIKRRRQVSKTPVRGGEVSSLRAQTRKKKVKGNWELT